MGQVQRGFNIHAKAKEKAKKEKTYQIRARHLCAGIVVADNTVIDAAPILGYMKGWSMEDVITYCKKKGWIRELVDVC